MYAVQRTTDLDAGGVLKAVEMLEAQAKEVNAKYGQGGLGVGAFAKQ